MDKDAHTIVGIRIGETASACVFEDNRITYFQKEESLTQNKQEEYPIAAFLEILNLVKKIDYIVFIDSLYPVEKNNAQFSVDLFFILAKKANKIKDDGVPRLIDMSMQQHKCEAAYAFYKSNWNNAFVINFSSQGGYWPISIHDEPTLIRETETVFKCNKLLNLNTVHKNMQNTLEQETLFWEGFDAEFWEKDGKFDFLVSSNPSMSDLYTAIANYSNWEEIDISKSVALSLKGSDNNKVPNFFIDNVLFPVIDKNIILRSNHGAELNRSSNAYLTDDNSHEATALSNRQDVAFKAIEESNIAIINSINYFIKKFNIQNAILVGDILQENLKLTTEITERHKNVDFFVLDDPYSMSSILGATLLWADNLEILLPDIKIYPKKTRYAESQIQKYLSDRNFNYKSSSAADVAGILQQNCVSVYSERYQVSKILFDPSVKNNHRFLNTVKERDSFEPFAAITTNRNYKTQKSGQTTILNEGNNDTNNAGIISQDNKIKIDMLYEENNLTKIVDEFILKTNQEFIGQTCLRKSHMPEPCNLQQAISNSKTLELEYLYLLDYELLISLDQA